MMTNKISFDKFIQEIVDYFNLKDNFVDFKLTPDEISKVFEKSNKKLKWEKIENWEPFECGNTNISDEYFIGKMLKGNYKMEGLVYIITDECFTDMMAYSIDSIELDEFIKNEYFNLHHICFFQPEDIIFFQPNERFISILHHAGFIGYYYE